MLCWCLQLWGTVYNWVAAGNTWLVKLTSAVLSIIWIVTSGHLQLKQLPTCFSIFHTCTHCNIDRSRSNVFLEYQFLAPTFKVCWHNRKNNIFYHVHRYCYSYRKCNSTVKNSIHNNTLRQNALSTFAFMPFSLNISCY